MRKGLEFLKPNHAGAMILKNGITANYGVISVDKINSKLVFYTGKGLREIWSPNLSGEKKAEAEKLKVLVYNKDEQKLKELGHIDVIDLDEIERVVF